MLIAIMITMNIDIAIALILAIDIHMAIANTIAIDSYNNTRALKSLKAWRRSHPNWFHLHINTIIIIIIISIILTDL